MSGGTGDLGCPQRGARALEQGSGSHSPALHPTLCTAAPRVGAAPLPQSGHLAGIRDRHRLALDRGTLGCHLPCACPKGLGSSPLPLEQSDKGKSSIFPSPPRSFPGAQGKPAFPEPWGWLHARLPAQEPRGWALGGKGQDCCHSSGACW